MEFEKSLSFAQSLDQNDELKSFRSKYHIPEKDGKRVIYFCGNSLGLQPNNAEAYFDKHFKKWRNMGVEGHFEGDEPWVTFHHIAKPALAHIVGAKPSEVVAMNNLTTNIHLLLATFYQPQGKRKKIIIEAGAFPSDHYAVSSFMKVKGVDPEENLITLEIPDDGYLSTESITDKIKEAGDELALVMLPGIQYYTGQFFDLKKITKAAHAVGSYAGFDLAHAVGNVTMNLHDDNVDFAMWCSYKYLNSGPGNVAGAFVHDKHSSDPDVLRLTGWWGHNEKTRFKMDNNFDPNPGVDGWMLSNLNILGNSIHHAALALFQEATMPRLRKKSKMLTGFLEFLIKNDKDLSENIIILTPSIPEERGCQLSLFFKKKGRHIFETLSAKGFVMDWREPNVIRVAPTPMYNTFEEVYKFFNVLVDILKEKVEA